MQKLSYALLCLILIHVFAQVLIIIFRNVFLLIRIILCLSLFSYSRIYACFLTFLYYLFFRDISLNSQEQFILFSVTFHLIFNGFSFIFVVIWAIFLSYPIYIRLIIRLFPHFYFVVSFELFSHSFYLLLCLFRVLVKLC